MNLRGPACFSLLMVLSTTGCNVDVPWRAGTPPPGWRSPVGGLLLDETAFPQGWQIDLEFPQDKTLDPTINHIAQEWWNPDEGSAGIMQSIWRAHTVEEAMETYEELRQSPVLLAEFTPSPGDFYVEFYPPSELRYQSPVADEFYVACGWIVWSYCEVVARYSNYVVDMRLDLEADHEGRIRRGLTYSEIEFAVEAMDAKFAEFLNALPLATSSP